MSVSSPLRTALGLALANLVLAAWIVGPRVTDVGNIDWMQGDVVANTFAWQAYRTEPGLGLSTRSLSWPLAIPIAMFDPMPLLAWTLKLFSPLLPVRFQYFGLVMLLNAALQGLFAYLLLWACVRKENGGWLLHLRVGLGAALIAASPVFYERLGYSVPVLTSHWFILAALWLYMRSDRAGVGASLVAFSALLLLAASTNPYLLVMASLIYVALLARFTLEHRWTRRTALFAPAPFIPALGALVLFGFLQIGGEGVVPGGGYGHYSSPLNTLVNPMKGLVGSSLLPPLSVDVEQQYEGYGYLGAGGIAVVVFGLGLARVRGVLYGPRTSPLLGLALLAFVAALPLALVFTIPEPLYSLLAIFRSSGRFIWLTHYILLALGTACIIRLWPPCRAALALTACVALQAVDLGAPFLELRARFANMEAVRFSDPMYRDLGVSHELLLVMPPWQCWTLQEPGYAWDMSEPINFLAIDNRLKTNSFYAGRLPIPQERHHCRDYAERLPPAPPGVRTAYLFSPRAFASFGAGVPDTHFCDTDGLFVLCRQDREAGRSDRVRLLLRRVAAGSTGVETPSR